MAKKRESLVDGAMQAMRIAVKKAIEEQERLSLPVPVWKHGTIELLKSSTIAMVRESKANYGSWHKSNGCRNSRGNQSHK